jgi:hypothetical protein
VGPSAVVEDLEKRKYLDTAGYPAADFIGSQKIN